MKGKKLISLLSVFAITASMAAIPTSAQTIQPDYSVQMDISEDNFAIPYDILSEISKHVSVSSKSEELNNELKKRQSMYNLTSDELFDLMVASITPEEQQNYLSHFRGRQIKVSFDGANIEVATIPESPRKMSVKATNWTNKDSKDMYAVRDACRETFTCYGDFESGYSNGYTYLDCTNVRSGRKLWSGYRSYTIKNSKLYRGPKQMVLGQGPLQDTYAGWDFTAVSNSAGTGNNDVSLFTSSMR